MPEIPIKTEPTHYDHLMVARNASLDVIRAAYRALTQKYHPDRNPDDAEATRLMQLINESYAVLCDPEKRKEYDQHLAEQDEQNLVMALETRRSLVPVLQEARPNGANTRRRSSAASFVFGIAALLIAGFEGYRYMYPQAAQSALDSLAARAHLAARPPPAAEDRRRLQTGAIDRPDPAPPAGGSSSSSSSSSMGSMGSMGSTGSSSSAASQTPVEGATKIAVQHPAAPAKPAAKPRVPRRVAQRPAPPRAADPAPVAEAPAAPPVDDLAEVRNKDPAAADHISSYCSTVAKTAVDPEKGGAACRRNETYAWKHFALNSHDAEVYEEVRSKCASPVYPDSYEAKEACVRYEGNRARVQ